MPRAGRWHECDSLTESGYVAILLAIYYASSQTMSLMSVQDDRQIVMYRILGLELPKCQIFLDGGIHVRIESMEERRPYIHREGVTLAGILAAA